MSKKYSDKGEESHKQFMIYKLGVAGLIQKLPTRMSSLSLRTWTVLHG